MANKKEKSANFRQGVSDAKKGKNNTPSTGMNWKTGAVIGTLLGGPIGGVIGGLLGDSDSTSRQKKQNQGAYKAGNKRK